MDKPFRTIDEQIEILQSRGLSIDGNTPSILEREGYYSIVNGYKGVFIDAERSIMAQDDRYIEGTTFSDLYGLFIFDRNLRMTMMRYFVQAESSLKAVCSYSFSREHRDDLEAYLDRASYRSEHLYNARVTRLINDFKRILNRRPYEGRGYKRDYIRYYATAHDEVPMWVLSKFLTLGQIFMFYEFQEEAMRNEIAKEFSRLYAETHEREIRISPRRLRLAFDHIKDFRNICAHDERMYCARASPSSDIGFNRVLEDLNLVLPKSENSRMLDEIHGLVSVLSRKLGGKPMASVLNSMGVSKTWETFPAAAPE